MSISHQISGIGSLQKSLRAHTPVLILFPRVTPPGITKIGNQGIGKSQDMETVRDISMQFLVSSTTTLYKSSSKNQGNPPWDLARIHSS